MTTFDVVSLCVALLSSLGVALLTIWSQRQDKDRDRMLDRQAAAETLLAAAINRIGTLEAEMKHLPTTESIGRLHDKMNAIGMDVSKFAGAQQAMMEVLVGALKSNQG